MLPRCVPFWFALLFIVERRAACSASRRVWVTACSALPLPLRPGQLGLTLLHARLYIA